MLSLMAVPAWTASPLPAAKSFDITGKVYADVNGNGKIDKGEAGVSSVAVYAYLPGKKTPYVANTDKNGVYTFHKLPAGTYNVMIILSKGYAFTTAASGSAKLPSTAISSINFGVAKNATISGYVFNDVNGDGKWNKGERGIAAPGYLILCRGDLSGKQIVNFNEIARAAPDKNGYYSFTGLLPGTYTVIAIFGADWPCTTDDSVTFTIKYGQTINLYNTYGLFGVIYKSP